MLISPGAKRQKMLRERRFDKHRDTLGFDKLVEWGLGHCKISRLPKSFNNLYVGSLSLHGNKLRSLPEGFESITIGADLALSNNQLQSLPAGFGNIAASSCMVK